MKYRLQIRVLTLVLSVGIGYGGYDLQCEAVVVREFLWGCLVEVYCTADSKGFMKEQ